MSEKRTEGGDRSTAFSILAIERKVERVLLNLYIPTFIKSVIKAIFA